MTLKASVGSVISRTSSPGARSTSPRARNKSCAMNMGAIILPDGPKVAATT
jgi:hypothetical protein